MSKKSDIEIENMLPHFYSVNPDSVILAVMDVLIDKVCSQAIPPGADRVAFLFGFYNIYFTTMFIKDDDLRLETSSVSVSKLSKFTAEDRNRTKSELQAMVENMSAENASKLLGQLMRSWLMNASREYLLSGEICGVHDVEHDSKVKIIQKYQTYIPRLFELNF